MAQQTELQRQATKDIEARKRFTEGALKLRKGPRHENGRRDRRQHTEPINGYDQLQGAWAVRYQVASKYAHKAMAQDKYDLLHSIIETLTEAELKANGAKPFTIGTMHRIASHCVADYWRSHYNATNGLNCGACSQRQRKECREDDLYSQCPKAIRVESLNQPIIDEEGNITELGERIADPNSLDIPVWERTSVWQIGYKVRLVAIALKLNKGEALTHCERAYLSKYRQKYQKRLC